MERSTRAASGLQLGCARTASCDRALQFSFASAFPPPLHMRALSSGLLCACTDSEAERRGQKLLHGRQQRVVRSVGARAVVDVHDLTLVDPH